MLVIVMFMRCHGAHYIKVVSIEGIISIVRSRPFTVLVSVACLAALSSAATGQSLPAPALEPSPSEALIRRARDLSQGRLYAESAEAWKQVVVAEPVLASFAQ